MANVALFPFLRADLVVLVLSGVSDMICLHVSPTSLHQYVICVFVAVTLCCFELLKIHHEVVQISTTPACPEKK